MTETPRLARRGDEALGVHVSVARTAPSLLDLGRTDVTTQPPSNGPIEQPQLQENFTEIFMVTLAAAVVLCSLFYVVYVIRKYCFDPGLPKPLPSNNRSKKVVGHLGKMKIRFRSGDFCGRERLSFAFELKESRLESRCNDLKLEETRSVTAERQAASRQPQEEPLDLTRKKILLLYARDCAQFNDLMATFRNLLKNNNFERFGRHLTVRSSEPMRAIKVSTEQHRNEGVGETGDPREGPPTNSIVQHDSHMRKSARIALVGGERANRSATAAPISIAVDKALSPTYLPIKYPVYQLISKDIVYDCYDPAHRRQVDQSPTLWMRCLVEDSSVRVVVVSSKCARLQQLALMNGYKLSYKEPHYLDRLFIYGLCDAMTIYRNIYQKIFSVT
ncbi:hypothetical protein PR048_028836 [Dryococelus australis]|uniref:Uncharacterized protein n=1 Tax=Dryococelus australis TaxID=614101 RepID=A0ABQ9GBP2_9NEOP|nr:hypothetical protein PR048_028836 [Dryococelus australis]